MKHECVKPLERVGESQSEWVSDRIQGEYRSEGISESKVNSILNEYRIESKVNHSLK